MIFLSRLLILATGVLVAACATPPTQSTAPSATGAAAPQVTPAGASPTKVVAPIAPTERATVAPQAEPIATSAPASTAVVTPPLTRTLLVQQPPLQGADVKALQQRLLELGYHQLGSADGVFGANTETAVRAFQTLNQLEVDGVVGPNTWARVYAAEAQGFELHAIVDTQRTYLLGAASGSNWIAPGSAAKLLQDTTYQLLRQDGNQQQATGKPPTLPEGEPCANTPLVMFREQVPADRPLGVDANWNTLPRSVTELPVTTAELQAPVESALRGLGLDHPQVHITRALRADVNGDGSQETIMASTYRAIGGHAPEPTAKAGDYSALLVLPNGASAASVIASDVITRDIGFGAPLAFDLLGLWDVNGDGTLEIAATSDYYEGASTSIYTFDGTTTKEVLTSGCGV